MLKLTEREAEVFFAKINRPMPRSQEALRAIGTKAVADAFRAHEIGTKAIAKALKQPRRAA